MSELNSLQIKNYLPHRYPFLLLDKVIEFHADEKLVALKNVTVNEPFFQGHFPQIPVMPGVLLIEAMAQASAMLGLLSGAGGRDGDPSKQEQAGLYYLVGVDKSRFRKTVGPGDSLRIESRLLGVKRNIWRFACRAEVDGGLVADAALLTTIAE